MNLIKVLKSRVVIFVIEWDLTRHLGKTYCVKKCKKNGNREFDNSGTLKFWRKYKLLSKQIKQLLTTTARFIWTVNYLIYKLTENKLKVHTVAGHPK